MAQKKSKSKALDYVLALVRLSLGWTFLWAFLDKTWGLGFTTCRSVESGLVEVGCEKAWINGGSPTTGFLKFGTDGPFAGLYQNLAGNSFVDFLFMAGLLCIGVALILGVAIKIATVSGVVLMLMMWTAVLPPEHNPFIDDHIIYALSLIAILLANDNQQLGLGAWWKKQDFVKNMPVLE